MKLVLILTLIALLVCLKLAGTWILTIIACSIVGIIVILFVFNSIELQMKRSDYEKQELHDEASGAVRIKEKLDLKIKALQSKIDELSMIHKVIESMMQTIDLNKILQVILGAIKKYLAYDRIIILLIDENEGTMRPVQSIGVDVDISVMDRLNINEPDCFIAECVKKKRPFIVPDVKNKLSPAYESLFNEAKGHKDIVAAVPLEAKGKMIGVLIVDNIHNKRPLVEKDLRDLIHYTNQAGLAIENANLYNMQKRFAEELQRQVNIAVEKLKKAQAQLIKSERLSALGEMAAVVAHEVRNPMASIRAGAQRINKKLADNDSNKKYTKYIVEETDRLERVVKNILIFSREPDPQLAPNDINKLINDVLYFLDEEMKLAGVKVKKSLEETLPEFPFDPALMRQVLLNILQNALHFTSSSERKELRAETVRNGNKVIIKISDTGPGIPKENVGKIFEPFFSTKPSGTGLGLVISQRIVESHKGKIEAENHPDGGAVFVITLSVNPDVKNDKKT
ncbi:MAG: GAF domain-containing protein [Elusimicrobia bacterium]|nr:GAF domain-containing protein [Elusimicrobiota bacterium]